MTDQVKALETLTAAGFKPLEGGVEASAFDSVAYGFGMGVMKGGARAGQFMGLAGAVAPMLLDRVLGPSDGNPDGKSRTDRYFFRLEGAENRAADFWTPGAHEVGKAGQILGGLGEVVIPLLAGGGNPLVTAVSVAGAQTAGTGIDLVKQGVDGNVAGGVAAIQGAAAYAGFKIPFLGNSLTSRMSSGAVGNVAVNAGGAALQSNVLKDFGYAEQAKQFDPLNVEARAVDVLTGILFGGVTHGMAPRRPMQLKPSEVDAVFATANARHFQESTAPGMPADMAASVAHQNAIERAVEQMMRGEPVRVADAITEAQFIKRPASPISSAITDAYGPAQLPPPVATPAAPTAAPKSAALIDTAQRLGVSAQDLAAVIHYETAGTMSPSIIGGKGNKYLGLIQFGPAEQKKYGAHGKQTFDEQLQAVEAYLKDRGLPQGADLATIYRTVNGGNPRAGLNLSDGNGTIAQHIAKIQAEHFPKVADFAGKSARATPENIARNQVDAVPRETPPAREIPRELTAQIEQALPPPEAGTVRMWADVPTTQDAPASFGADLTAVTRALMGPDAPPLRYIDVPNADVAALHVDAATGRINESSLPPALVARLKSAPDQIIATVRDSIRATIEQQAQPRVVGPAPDTPPLTAPAAAPPLKVAADPVAAAPKVQTPELETARQAAEAAPDVRVTLDDGTELTAREALALAHDDIAKAETDGKAFMAAITCFLRNN